MKLPHRIDVVEYEVTTQAGGRAGEEDQSVRQHDRHTERRHDLVRVRRTAADERLENQLVEDHPDEEEHRHDDDE